MQLSDFLAHIITSICCGLTIGLERQWRQHPAGLRTNALISLGACLFASLSTLVEHDSSPTRVAGQIVTGVGFLAGGVILRDGLTVKGLTTAATIWCTAAIGTLTGCGFLLYAFISTCCVLFLNFAMHPLGQWVDRATKKWSKPDQRFQLLVTTTTECSSLVRMMIVEYFQAQHSITLQSITQRDGKESGTVQVLGQFAASEKCDDALEGLMGILHLEKGVSEVRWDKQLPEPSA